MVLFLSVSLLGIEAGVLLGFMPSIVSGFVGFAPLTPFIPYIIASNAILAVSFGLIGKKWGKPVVCNDGTCSGCSSIHSGCCSGHGGVSIRLIASDGGR